MSTKTLDTRARYCLNMSQSDENAFPLSPFYCMMLMGLRDVTLFFIHSGNVLLFFLLPLVFLNAL